MKILVTGGAGFIGSNFVHYLLRHDAECAIVNVDLLTYAGNLRNLGEALQDPRHRFVHTDISDRSTVYPVLAEGVDAIVNFAAESHVDRSIEDPETFLRTNVIGTRILLEGARRYGVKRFLQISTDEVYGSLDPPGKFSETSPLFPNSPYAASKAAADLLVRAYTRTYNLPAIITRSSNNFGPYQFPEKLIPLFITNAMVNEPLPLYGDGQNVRDWIYVEDHCAALALVLAQGSRGEVYHIGASNERTNQEVGELILRELGKPLSLIRYVADRPGHDRRYALDSSKIAGELGWRPSSSFEDRLRQTIRWYQDNERWWREIKSGEYRGYYERMYGERLRHAKTTNR